MVIAEPDTPPWWKRVVPILNARFLQSGRPLKLPEYETTQVPSPADWKACLIYDRSLDQVKVSDGVTWNAL